MMNTIENIYIFTTEVNRSKFITYFVPISGYKDLQQTLKKEHPKSSHVVYALRRLNEFEQIVENSSDDGEPKGCAGVPALNVLRGEKCVNCAIVIVRYFGGIKLGTGGMARAYALAVKNVIKEATFIKYEKEVIYLFSTSYSEVNKTLYKLRKFGFTKYERDFGIEKVEWKIVGSDEKILQFKNEEKL